MLIDEYDPFDACNIAQWTAYVMASQDEEIWQAMHKNSFWNDYYQYGMGFTGTQVDNAIWQDITQPFLDASKNMDIDGSWECDFWIPAEYFEDQDHRFLLIFFKSQYRFGDTQNFFVSFAQLHRPIQVGDTNKTYHWYITLLTKHLRDHCGI